MNHIQTMSIKIWKCPTGRVPPEGKSVRRKLEDIEFTSAVLSALKIETIFISFHFPPRFPQFSALRLFLFCSGREIRIDSHHWDRVYWAFLSCYLFLPIFQAASLILSMGINWKNAFASINRIMHIDCRCSKKKSNFEASRGSIFRLVRPALTSA